MQQQQFDATKVATLAGLLKQEQALLYQQGQLVVELISTTETEDDKTPLAKRIESLVDALLNQGVHDDKKTLTARLLRARQIYLASQTLGMGESIAHLPITGQKALATLSAAVDKGAVKLSKAQAFAQKLSSSKKDGNAIYESVQTFLGKTPKKGRKEPTTDNEAKTATTAATTLSLPQGIIDALSACSAASDAAEAGFTLGKDARVPRSFIVAAIEGFVRRNPKKIMDSFESVVEEVKHRIA